VKAQLRSQATRALAILAASFTVFGCSTPDTRDPQSGRSSTRPTSELSKEEVSRYRDGSYSAVGWYGGQPSRLGVRITIEDGIIESVDVTTYATDPTSLDYQQRFADAVPSVVIGKHIDDADVGRVAGASGCSDGFNDALRRIRAGASGPV